MRKVFTSVLATSRFPAETGQKGDRGQRGAIEFRLMMSHKEDLEPPGESFLCSLFGLSAALFMLNAGMGGFFLYTLRSAALKRQRAWHKMLLYLYPR